MASSIEIEWGHVVDAFSHAFNFTFGEKGKKAHVDSLVDVPFKDRMIDGAKEKWLTIILLDAIVFASLGDIPLRISRRLFNQVGNF